MLDVVRKKQAVVKPSVLNAKVVVDVKEAAAFGAGLLEILAVIEELRGFGASTATARILAGLKQNRVHTQLKAMDGTEKTGIASANDQPVTAFVRFTKVGSPGRRNGKLLLAANTTSVRAFGRTIGHIGQ